MKIVVLMTDSDITNLKKRHAATPRAKPISEEILEKLYFYAASRYSDVDIVVRSPVENSGKEYACTIGDSQGASGCLKEADENLKKEKPIAGIAVDDDVVRALQEKPVNFPMLALSGISLDHVAKDKREFIPLLPSPRFWGFLVARAMLPQVERKTAEKKKVKIAVVNWRNSVQGEKAGDRNELIKDVMKWSFGEEITVIESSSKDLEKEISSQGATHQAGEVDTSSKDIKPHEFVVIYGRGEGFTEAVKTYCREMPDKTFWVDYHCELESKAYTFPGNLNTLCIKSCYGRKVFTRLACVALDLIFRWQRDGAREKCMTDWFKRLQQFSSDVGPIFFSKDAGMPILPYYCNCVRADAEREKRPVDFYGITESVSDVQVVKFLSAIDQAAIAANVKCSGDSKSHDAKINPVLFMENLKDPVEKSFPMIRRIGFMCGGEVLKVVCGERTQAEIEQGNGAGPIPVNFSNVTKQTKLPDVDILNPTSKHLCQIGPVHKESGTASEQSHAPVTYTNNNSNANSNASLSHEEIVWKLMRSIAALPRPPHDDGDLKMQINLRHVDVENNGVKRLFVDFKSSQDGSEISLPILCAKEDELNRAIVSIRRRRSEMSGLDSSKASKGVVAWYSHLRNCDFEKDKIRYLYLFDFSHVAGTKGKSNESGWMACVSTSEKLYAFEFQILSQGVKSILMHLARAQAKDDLRGANLKSAVGSIMSRNGSHNIGSHVLAALSHNVGSMPEDRRLYQYIQHRMDYIATATTEFPAWRQPTRFVGEILKNFLSQTHLLDYISRSEGLRAYRFQGAAADSRRKEVADTIQLHVRRANKVENDVLIDEGAVDFIAYSGEDIPKVEDTLVAIPGGVVGQHAVFTLLENTIRNVAKHEWVRRKAKKNLDIYVDFLDNAKEGVVEIQISSNMLHDETTTDKDVKRLNDRLEGAFVTEQLGLKLENWGLAEMRIAAGYLKSAPIEKIGEDRKRSDESRPLVRAVNVERNGKFCIGYRFAIPKPKELLIVLPENREFKHLDQINCSLGKYGIEVRSHAAVKPREALAYSFVVLEDRESMPGLRAPFRILSGRENKSGTPVCTQYDEIIKMLTGLVTSYSDLVKKLVVKQKIMGTPARKPNDDKSPEEVAQDEAQDKFDEGCKCFSEMAMKSVCADWINHLKKIRGIEKHPIEIVVDSMTDGKSSGKSLVTDLNLLHYIFGHSFNAAVRSFFDIEEPPDVPGPGEDEKKHNEYWRSYIFARGMSCLAAYREKSPKTIRDLQAIGEGVKSTGVPANETVIRYQLREWAQELKTHQELVDGLDKGRRIADEWVGFFKGAQDRNPALDAITCVESIENWLEGRMPLQPIGDKFIAYLSKVVLEQTRSFLSRYEEEIATLPAPARIPSGGRSDAVSVLDKDGRIVSLRIMGPNGDRRKVSDLNAKTINYWRHADGKDGRPPPHSLFLEPLSGSQSYFSSMESLTNEQGFLLRDQAENFGRRLPVFSKILRMVENGLLRITLIDERVKKFADEHPDVADVFRRLGIQVYDDNCRLTDMEKKKKSEIGACEIMVIHQGIVDKKTNAHTQKGVREYLNKLKDKCRYLVITTGRGMPSNIPDGARVLPFSVIESTLFKRYPEKLLLVDTIMNILPVSREGEIG